MGRFLLCPHRQPYLFDIDLAYWHCVWHMAHAGSPAPICRSHLGQEVCQDVRGQPQHQQLYGAKRRRDGLAATGMWRMAPTACTRLETIDRYGPVRYGVVWYGGNSRRLDAPCSPHVVLLQEPFLHVLRLEAAIAKAACTLGMCVWKRVTLSSPSVSWLKVASFLVPFEAIPTRKEVACM